MVKFHHRLIFICLTAVAALLVLFLTQNTLDARSPEIGVRCASVPRSLKADGVQDIRGPLSAIHQPTLNLSGILTETNLYRNYDLKKPRMVILGEDRNEYFVKRIAENGKRCLAEGTSAVREKCVCRTGWHGTSCSITDLVADHNFPYPERLKVRQNSSRRLIYAMTFNIDFEMLEIRFRETGDLIDILLIVESNYTGTGDRKGLYLLEKLKQGFLVEYQHKIVYVYLDHFPVGTGPEDEKFTDYYMKSFAAKQGLLQIKGTRPDDVLIVADADELHRREALLFLKLHDGYPEPVGIYLRRHVFGFYWCSGVTHIGFACSLRMLENIYSDNAGYLRQAIYNNDEFSERLQEHKRMGNYVHMWSIGSDSISGIGGWHCSWCYEPERVRTKLLSAFRYDFPRWGDFPEKTDLDYIKKLIKVGMWFDEESLFKPQFIGCHTPYAPAFVLQNLEHFKQIVFNPYIEV